MEQKTLVPSVGCMVFASGGYLTQGILRDSEVHQQGELSGPYSWAPVDAGPPQHTRIKSGLCKSLWS